MDDQHENRGDSQRGGTSGPFEQGGRYYVFLDTVGWEGGLAALLYDFEDVREAVEYVRHGFIPAALTGAPGVPQQAAVREQAKTYFPAGSPRLASFGELVDTCDSLLMGQEAVEEEDVEGVMALFNKAFKRAHDSREWNPPLYHFIFSHGSLARMLVILDVVEELLEQHDADPETPYEFEELAVALVNGVFDDHDPHHRALAKEYFESSIALTR